MRFRQISRNWEPISSMRILYLLILGLGEWMRFCWIHAVAAAAASSITCSRDTIEAAVGEEIEPVKCEKPDGSGAVLYVENLPEGLVWHANTVSGASAVALHDHRMYVHTEMLTFEIRVDCVFFAFSRVCGSWEIAGCSCWHADVLDVRNPDAVPVQERDDGEFASEVEHAAEVVFHCARGVAARVDAGRQHRSDRRSCHRPGRGESRVPRGIRGENEFGLQALR